MFDTRKVEDWQPNPQEPLQLKLRGTNHYVRIGVKDEGGPFYICHGHVYVDGGHEIALPDLPASFWTEVKKITPAQLAVVEFANMHPPTLVTKV